MEHLLHYAWKHKLFDAHRLQTTDGTPIEVIDPGRHNRDAGPDFFNARLRIGGRLWAGHVELHSRASDWYRHGHEKDEAYDAVVLHVVGESDAEVRRTNDTLIPQAVLVCPEHVTKHYDELRRADGYPCCQAVLPHLSRLSIHGWLSGLQAERLEAKRGHILRYLHHTGNHWEDVCFVALARGCGFSVNGDACERWALSLPFRALDKHRDRPFQVEAIFLGQARFLDEVEAVGGADDYAVQLKREYEYLKHKFGFAPTIEASAWRFLRLRPDNFPTIRVAQLAWLYAERSSLFSQLVEADTVDRIHSLLSMQTSPYWETHYRLGVVSPRRTKTMSRSSLNLLTINSLVPLLYAYGRYKGDEQLCERALSLLEQLPAEENHIIRSWATSGLSVASAADSQALIQLQRAYCERRRCLFCRFGYEYIRHCVAQSDR